ncbi:MAG: glycine--tRNA ligase [Clostridia bacterium]|nr:glycine--tRNA ligase [Clostridia bacterium]
MEKNSKINMERLVNHCKNMGIIFAGSEIYGGLANSWDYGPVGVELKNNIKQAWWKKFVQENENSVGVDASILMNPKVWEASGHLASFSDPLMDCKNCKTRHRADKLIEGFSKDINPDTMTNAEMESYIIQNKIACPNCGKRDFTPIRQFNLMFETNRGVTKESSSVIYLRPETAQGEFVNFLNVQRSLRMKLPFGIGQIGKAFRNEITPGNFTFRTIEFEQMEHQLFCKEGDDDKFYQFYKDYSIQFLTSLGLPQEKLKFKDHEKLAHYAKNACDVQYKFVFGFDEINGIHNRTNYDLSRHQEFSGKNMEYLDGVTNEKFIPFIIEASYGLDRIVLAVLDNAFDIETLADGTEREILRIKPSIAPFKIAILPLIKKNHNDKAKEIFKELRKHFRVIFDETGSIGKRYRRQDAIGTPFCLTVDDNTLENGIVTIRDRDTMEQVSLKVEEVACFIEKKIRE